MTNQKLVGCTFHHVALSTRDWEKTWKFYAALGFTPAREWGAAPGRAAFLDCGSGGHIEVFEKPDAPEAGTGVLLHFCFGVEDIHASVEIARRAGAEITLEPKTVVVNDEPPVWMAFFKGPNGEIVELFSENHA